MATDGTIRPDGTDYGVFECDSNRYAVMRAGLHALEAQWPPAKNWTVAVAGFSGGTNHSGYMSVILMLDGYSLIEMWMGGCNENTPGVPRIYNDPGERYLEIPIFLGAGAQDKIATVADDKTFCNTLKSCGSKFVRMKTHGGGHSEDSCHVLEGLLWFSEQMGGMSTYKIAFNDNGGKGKMAVQTLTYGKPAKLRKNTFVRSGYTFADWAKTKKGAVAYKNRAQVKNLRADGKMPTLYANWAKVRMAPKSAKRGVKETDGLSSSAEKESLAWAGSQGPVDRGGDASPVPASGGGNADAVADGNVGTVRTADAEHGAWVVLAFPEALDVGDVQVAVENLPERIRCLLSEDAEEWWKEGSGRAGYVWGLSPQAGSSWPWGKSAWCRHNVWQ